MSQKTPLKGNLKKKITSEDLHQIYELNDQKLYKADLNGDQDPDNIMKEIYEKISSFANSTNRKTFYQCLAVYYYNQAYLFHKKQQSLSAVSAIQNCLKNYEYLRGFLNTREQNIAHNIELIKVYLQCCAIMSQVGKHSISIVYAEKSLQKLIQCFRVLQAICQEEMSLISGCTKIQEKDCFPKIEKVCFKNKVLNQAKKLLDELSTLPMIHKLLSEEKHHFQKITNHMYFWKNNHEQNEKNIRKQMEMENKKTNRNILGLHKTSKVAQKFHIGSLMSMEFKRMSNNPKTEKFYLLSSEKLTQLVLYVSVCYFTLATQTRFNQLDEDIESLKIMDRYQKLNHDAQIKKCKIIHMKAIEIAGKHLPVSNQYFQHLLQSFNKNYKLVLDQIEEVSEMGTLLEQSKMFQIDQPSYQYGIVRRNRQKINFQKGSHKVEIALDHKIKSKSKKSVKKINHSLKTQQK